MAATLRSVAEPLNLFRYDHFAPLPQAYRSLAPAERDARIRAARGTLGERLLILGHNYQRWECNKFADALGDSFKLSRIAADSRAAHIVFLGVTFMAETADIVTGGGRNVIIPSMEASCPMAGMAETVQVERAWDQITSVIPPDELVPITYMNSYADLKAFTGRHDGAVCTSSNAYRVFDWAFAQGKRILFMPDEHLGMNTAEAHGLSDDDWVVWNPWDKDFGGVDSAKLARAKVVLWKGFCQVHERFKPHHVEAARAAHPDVKVVVHPDCRREVVRMADHVGSTEEILRVVREAPSGSAWAVGTEVHLVNYLQMIHPDKRILQLCGEACLDCNAMRQVDPNYLVWVLEELVAGRVVNRVSVPEETARWARVAVDRMLAIP